MVKETEGVKYSWVCVLVCPEFVELEVDSQQHIDVYFARHSQLLSIIMETFIALSRFKSKCKVSRFLNSFTFGYYHT